MTPQEIAETDSAKAEHAFETWRGWQQQYALQEIERRLEKNQSWWRTILRSFTTVAWRHLS